MTRYEIYKDAIKEYSNFLVANGQLNEDEEPLRYLIIERKLAYRNNQTIHMFQVYNYESSEEFWGFIARQRSYQSSNKDRPVFSKEKVIDLDTGENITDTF